MAKINRLCKLSVAIALIVSVSACGPSTPSTPPVTAAQLDANVAGLIAQKNYDGALVVSNTLIKRFPESAEAASARAHLDELQPKAEKQRSEQQAVVQAKEQTVNDASARVGTDRLEGCRSKLKEAQKLEVLYDLDWKSSAAPKVIVGRTFYKIPIDAKEGFVDTVNCFLMAGDDKYIDFDVLDWRSGQAVGRYHFGHFAML